MSILTILIFAVGVPVTLLLSLFIQDQHQLLLAGVVGTAVAMIAVVVFWRWVGKRGRRDRDVEQPWMGQEPERGAPVLAWQVLKGANPATEGHAPASAELGAEEPPRPVPSPG